MPFLDNTLLFQRTAIQCSSVTKLYSAVACPRYSIPFQRCGLPITSVPSPGYSMLFRSGVVQFQGVSLPFLRLSELFPVQTTRRNSAARLIYPMPLLGKSKQISAALFTSVASRLTTYLRCSMSGRYKAGQNYSMAFHFYANPRPRIPTQFHIGSCQRHPLPSHSISWLAYSVATLRCKAKLRYAVAAPCCPPGQPMIS